MKASIIIPLLHQEDSWLQNCVHSALTQTIPSQVIVVTSARTPKSNIETLHDIGKCCTNLTMHQQSEEGFAKALNEGIQIAQTDRIGFLLSDDWLLPTALERSLCYQADIVSTSLLTFSADGNTPIEDAHSMLTQAYFDELETLESKANYLSHFFLFRRQILLSVGGLDETIGDSPGIDDYDLIWTLLEHKASVAIVEEPLYCYRDHTLERLTLRKRTDQVKTLNRIWDKHGVSGVERAALFRTHLTWLGKPIHVVLGSVKNM